MSDLDRIASAPYRDFPVGFYLNRREGLGSPWGSGVGSIISSSRSLSKYIVFSASASGNRAYVPILFLRLWARKNVLHIGCFRVACGVLR